MFPLLSIDINKCVVIKLFSYVEKIYSSLVMYERYIGLCALSQKSTVSTRAITRSNHDGDSHDLPTPSN